MVIPALVSLEWAYVECSVDVLDLEEMCFFGALATIHMVQGCPQAHSIMYSLEKVRCKGHGIYDVGLTYHFSNLKSKGRVISSPSVMLTRAYTPKCSSFDTKKWRI